LSVINYSILMLCQGLCNPSLATAKLHELSQCSYNSTSTDYHYVHSHRPRCESDSMPDPQLSSDAG